MIKQILNLYFQNKNPIKYWRKKGAKIGNNSRIVGNVSFGTEPYLIKIGDHCLISFGVTFITHDGSTWVFREKEKYKNVVKYGRIEIGNNVFIGARTIILPNVKIGNNCIIGAGSIVSKDVPDNEVWCGVPAKFVSKTDEYAEKCLSNTPPYNLDNYRKNKKEEVERICDGYYEL